MYFSSTYFISKRKNLYLKYFFKIFFCLSTFVTTIHGGRLLRYNGCDCGIENVPKVDFYHNIGTLSLKQEQIIYFKTSYANYLLYSEIDV